MSKSNRRITIVDIARELGVSSALVSMVLSGKGQKHRINKQTSKKVFETAKELGYNPNLLARALRTGKTGVLGLIVADISNPFFAMIARLLENEAYVNGCDVMFSSSDEDLDKFNKLGNAFITRQVDGLIISPVTGSGDIIAEWQSRGIPIVSIDRYISSLNIPYAVTDNYDASMEIIKFIIKKGYKKIAYVGKQSNLSSFTDREEGFIDGTKELDISPDNFTVFRLDYLIWEVEIREVIKTILNERFDIIFFGQNVIGIEGLRIFNSMNIRIPDDIAVISFDNPEVFEFNKPSITCFEQPLDILAKKSFHYLRDLIEGKSGEKSMNQKFKGRLIIRESC